MEYRIFKNYPDMHKKESNIFIAKSGSQKDKKQQETDAALQNGSDIPKADVLSPTERQ